MTDRNKTLIAAVLDRTGSMGMIKTDAEGSFANFVKEQRESQVQVGDEVVVSLYQFAYRPPHESLETICEFTPIANVRPYVIEPDGLTPLHDAIAMSINRVGDQLAAFTEDRRPNKVIFVILTDGRENHSREYTRDQVLELVKRQQDQWSWEFVFMGVGIDAWDVGRHLGFKQENTISVAATGEGVERGYGQVSASVTHLRAQR
jgi:uncharacterized protein YegL